MDLLPLKESGKKCSESYTMHHRCLHNQVVSWRSSKWCAQHRTAWTHSIRDRLCRWPKETNLWSTSIGYSLLLCPTATKMIRKKMITQINLATSLRTQRKNNHQKKRRSWKPKLKQRDLLKSRPRFRLNRLKLSKTLRVNRTSMISFRVNPRKLLNQPRKNSTLLTARSRLRWECSRQWALQLTPWTVLEAAWTPSHRN